MKEPYDWETYPDFFTPKAEELEGKAKEAETAGKKDEACEYYLYCNPLTSEASANEQQALIRRLPNRSFPSRPIKEARDSLDKVQRGGSQGLEVSRLKD
jgi:hypothetical protein